MGEGFYKASKLVIAPVLRGTWRFKVTGRENFPEGGAIVASNHLSYLDSYFIPAVAPKQVFFVSKAEHFDNRFQRWFFEQWGVIPLNRGAGDNEAFDRSLQVLREGKYLGLHPEGTRSVDGKLHRGRTGVARLALKARVPVVPVGIVGTDKILPKGKSVPSLIPRCEIHVGEPLTFEEFYGEEDDRKVTRELTDRVMMAIKDLSGQEYVDVYTQNPAAHGKNAPPQPAEIRGTPRDGTETRGQEEDRT